MSIFDKIKGVLNPDENYDDYEEIDGEEEQETDMEIDNNQKTNKAPISFGYAGSTSRIEENQPKSPASKLQVVLVKPTGFEDVRGISDNLNRKNTVVLNLEAASKEISQRILDFLGGVAYANSGKISKVANSTYIITPFHVDMHGEEVGEFDVNSLF